MYGAGLIYCSIFLGVLTLGFAVLGRQKNRKELWCHVTYRANKDLMTAGLMRDFINLDEGGEYLSQRSIGKI